MINLGTGEACDQIWKHEEQGETCSISRKQWKQVVTGGKQGNMRKPGKHVANFGNSGNEWLRMETRET